MRVLPSLAAAALVLAPWHVSAASDAPALPPAAAASLEAFRKIPWDERCKPIRPDPAPDGWQQRVATESAFASLGASEVPAVQALLADGDRFVRALAARTLGLVSDSKCAPALVAALASEKDKLARVALIEALARTGGEGALAAVEAQQAPGGDPDIAFMAGLARRQLKGAAWDLANLRSEFEEARRAQPVAAIGKEAPEIGLPGAEKPVNLGTLRGKVVVLVFTHGDRDAVGEKVIHRLTTEEHTFERLDVKFVVVDPHEKERTVLWAKKMTLPFVTFASDPAARAATLYGVAKQVVAGGEWQPSPAWFVIDRKGRLVWRKLARQQSEHASLGELLPVLEKVSLGIELK